MEHTTKEAREMEEKANLERPEAAAGLSRYERVKLARHQERPFTIDYISDLSRA